MADENELLTVDEASAKLRVNSDTIRRLMRQQRLPGVKVGSQWRISAAGLKQYVQGGPPAAPIIDGKPANEPLPAAMSKKLAKKAATDPKWKNKTTGAKKT